MLTRLSSFSSLLLATILILIVAAGLASTAQAATPASVSAASAASILGKDAQLNGARLAAGAALFPGDVVRLGEDSTAALEFGSTLVLADSGTELRIETGGVSLRNGRLQVRAGGENFFAISAPFFRVNIAASGAIPSSAEVRLNGTLAQVSAVAGAADLITEDGHAHYTLHAGNAFTLDAIAASASPAQIASNPAAGQVSRLLPQVQIDRAPAAPMIAKASDRVYWNDTLRSGPTGRAHVTLTDGSQLNLGSDSTLRILQHDAQSQQTSLDLLAGRLRAKITKLSRPGAKFEIRTPVGVAGLVGTDFSLVVSDTDAHLTVFEGSVRFTNLSVQSSTVAAGNTLRILKSGEFEGPSPATVEETQTAQNLTDISGQANAGPPPVAASPIVPLAITAVGSAIGIGIGVWQGMRPVVSTSIP